MLRPIVCGLTHIFAGHDVCQPKWLQKQVRFYHAQTCNNLFPIFPAQTTSACREEWAPEDAQLHHRTARAMYSLLWPILHQKDFFAPWQLFAKIGLRLLLRLFICLLACLFVCEASSSLSSPPNSAVSVSF